MSSNSKKVLEEPLKDMFGRVYTNGAFIIGHVKNRYQYRLGRVIAANRVGYTPTLYGLYPGMYKVKEVTPYTYVIRYREPHITEYYQVQVKKMKVPVRFVDGVFMLNPMEINKDLFRVPLYREYSFLFNRAGEIREEEAIINPLLDRAAEEAFRLITNYVD